MATDKRSRHLRNERERKHRTADGGQPPQVSDAPNMRFRCGTCGAEMTSPGSVMISDLEVHDQDGNLVFSGPMGGLWQMPCLICGQMAQAINQHTVSSGGATVTGFADTPQQMQDLLAALDELRGLREDASAEEIIGVLEKRGPQLQPVIDYLRTHHLELTMLGASLLSLVVALLTWLMPLGEDHQPEVPDGITEKQMERLIDELRAEPSASPDADTVSHDGETERDDGQPQERRPRRGGPDG